ncbi:hypothetical protein FRC12_007087, partial [Ceratobasidium sp. 428]
MSPDVSQCLTTIFEGPTIAIMPEQTSRDERRFRCRLKGIKLEPNKSAYEVVVGLQVDGAKIHKLPSVKKGQRLHWDQLCLPCDVTERSTITVHITEVHSFGTRNRVGKAFCHLSQLADRDEVLIGCEDNIFNVQITFIGGKEAKQAYLEAFRKVEQIETLPGLVEKARKFRSAFKTLLDLGSLMARLCPTEGAEVVFSLCTKAWEHLEQQGNQDTELTELVKQLARMIPSIESVTSLADNNLKETLMDMLNLIEDVSLFILGTRPRGPFERALRAAASSEEQSRAYIAKFKELRKEFDLRMSAQVLRAVEIEKRNAKLRDLKPADLAGYDPNR